MLGSHGNEYLEKANDFEDFEFRELARIDEDADLFGDEEDEEEPDWDEDDEYLEPEDDEEDDYDEELDDDSLGDLDDPDCDATEFDLY